MTESSPSYERVRLSANKYIVAARLNRVIRGHRHGRPRGFCRSIRSGSWRRRSISECLRGNGRGASPTLGLRNLPASHKPKSDAAAATVACLGWSTFSTRWIGSSATTRRRRRSSCIRERGRRSEVDDLQERLQLQPDPTQDAVAAPLRAAGVRLSQSALLRRTARTTTCRTSSSRICRKSWSACGRRTRCCMIVHVRQHWADPGDRDVACRVQRARDGSRRDHRGRANVLTTRFGPSRLDTRDGRPGTREANPSGW